MIRCDNCGTDNLDGSEYCDECGMKLDFAPPPGRGIEVPAYQPPGGAGRVASRNGDVSQRRLEEAPRGGDVPVPAPPAFTTSTSIPKPARPVRDARRPQASQPPSQPQPAGPSVQSIQGGQENVVPGQTLALSSRGRTDSLRSEPPYAAGVPKVTTRLVIERGGRIGREFPIGSVETHIG
ncbi:MAG: zinc-ribbon domain-containing protein, partial [Blastocatellia bacterium]